MKNKYITKKLSEGEKIVYAAKLHWSEYISNISLLILIAGANLALFYFKVIPKYADYVTYISISIVFLSFFSTFIRRKSTEIVITNQRIAIKKGLISLKREGMPLSKVEGVNANQSIIGRIFSCGDVEISGSGETKLYIRKISRPMDFRDALASLIS